MDRWIKEILLLLVMTFTVSNVNGAEESFFDFSINKNSIYTPEKVIFSLQLNDVSVLAGKYRYDIQIFAESMLLKRRSVLLDQESEQKITFEFKGIERKTTCRCRIALFLDNAPLEAKELFLTLYPATFKPLIRQQEAVIWAFDESGRLQQKLDEIKVKYVDANFQLLRDFIPPDILLIGENIHPVNMDLLINSYEKYLSDSVWIYLKQESLDFFQDISLAPSKGLQRTIICDYDKCAFEKLSPAEFMDILNKGECIQVLNDTECIENYIGKKSSEEEAITSMLIYIKNGAKQSIYCQIPLLEEGPVGDILLASLINCGVIKSQRVN